MFGLLFFACTLKVHAVLPIMRFSLISGCAGMTAVIVIGEKGKDTYFDEFGKCLYP